MDLTKFKNRMQGVLPPEELPSFFQALDTMGARPKKSIRIRRDLTAESAKRWTPARLIEEGIPIGERVTWYDHGYFFDLSKMNPHPSKHPLIAAGLVFIQEAGAMEVVPALEVEPSHLVLDLCAAPGAKSTHLGEYLGSEGWLVANEPVRDRAKLLDAILSRHGISNSTVYNLEPHRLAKVFPGVFDRILVDAPCSGESLFAKREEKRKDVTDKEVERCALRQSAILKSAAEMLAPGGRIVYSTCAYSRTENEEVVAEFLGGHPELRLLREVRRFPHRDGVPGGYFAILGRAGETPARADREAALREGIREVGERGLVRNGIQRWDGSPDFYAEAMDRRGSKSSLETVSRQELSREDAIRYLESGFPKEKSNVLYEWEGETLAVTVDGKCLYPKAKLR